MNLIKDTNGWRKVYNKNFYQLFLVWGNKDDELLAYVKDCLSDSDFKEDEYSPLDICELEIYEEEDEDLECWADFALTDGIWEETGKEDVISFLERNYPDIELHKTVDGTVFGGRYGQDSLEFRKDHLIIFRGNHSLKYSDIKSGKDIKKFIDRYLPY